MKTGKKTILLVEDNRLVYSIYQTWLQRYGFKVEGAGDGEMALKKLPQLRPDAVILDYMMPKLNGLGVLKFIRSHPELKQTPVLGLSNSFMDEEALKALDFGLNMQLHKAECTPKLLVQTIRELLGLLPPPDWSSAVFPPPADSDGPDGKKPHACVDGRCCRKHFTRIREESLTFAKEAGSPAGADQLKTLYQHVQFMSVRAAEEGCMGIVRVASGLAEMLLEISLKKLPPPPSVLQTITQSVDCLGCLFKNGALRSTAAGPAAKVLVVEDNPICSLAAMTAMKRAKLDAVSTPDPQAALEMARTAHYDAFLLDINLPGTDGFEVCKKLRLLPQYKKTPVIFVTSSTELEKRAQAVLSGGNDLVAKPIWPQELALKMVMRLAESSAQPAGKTPAVTSARPAAAPESHKAIEKNTPPGNGKLVMAKHEPPGAATNGNTAKAPAGRDSSNPAPHHRAPHDTESSAPPHPAFKPSSFNRTDPSHNGMNRDKFVVNRDGDNPFNKMTREIARIEASALNPISPASLGRKHERPVKNRVEDGALDKIIREITRILFGEDMVTGLSLHLTRIAIESRRIPEIINHAMDTDAGTNGSRLVHDYDERFEEITREVAGILFSDEDISETHLRLTRTILERCRLSEIIAPDSSSNSHPNRAKPAADELEAIHGESEKIRATFAARRKSAGLARVNKTITSNGSALKLEKLQMAAAT